MDSSNAGSLVLADWNAFLIKAPQLIHQLGICTALAATRDATQIRLSGPDIEYPGLASNLVAIASQGQDAFLATYSDMLEIATKTNNMGKIGGLLDQVVERFSNPSAERSTRRLLDQLQSDIDDCNASGKRTKGCFLSWQRKIGSVRIAILEACREKNERIASQENTIKSLTMNMARTYLDLNQAQNEKDLAERKHEEALAKQYEREAELNSFAAVASRMSLAFSFGMVGLIAGAGTSLYLSASAASTVARAEAELEQQRLKARDLNHFLQNNAIDLEGFKTENKGLEFLIQRIINVLDILNALTSNITKMMEYFTRINIEIAALVKTHEFHIKKIAEDKSNGEMEDVDYEDFETKGLEMKKHALNIHALSTLYSVVITDVIDPGFSLALESSHHIEGSTELAVAHRHRGIDRYRDDAEKSCIELSLTAKRTLQERFNELDRVQQSRRPRRAQAGISPPRTGSDIRGHSRFSRLNPFRRDR